VPYKNVCSWFGDSASLLGIGMPIVAVPLLNLIVDLRVTVVLLAILLIITNIPQAIVGDHIQVLADYR
jgi:hypothetical protein